ncbi:hypothetical protein ACH4VS_15680 [Streptomyces hygroscopicus]|uniref:hypothetical protein n=1 Tax=Streptomyces hygroscopicus TaxID=1912 RepID=UPI0008346A27|nr:hypothetical protein [Streptomyces hygroscopicus]GLV78953.1 hypothetical protein Shyhy02_69530 [Streptomyces hygroscopicus subsp. hygroscopicus]
MAHSTSGNPAHQEASARQDAVPHGGGTGPGTPPPPTRRGMLAVAAAAGVGLLAGCGEKTADSASGAGPQGSRGAQRSPSATPSERSPSPTPKPRPELPRGGRELSRYRLVGYCGLPGAAALGRLGTGDLDDRVREIEKTARAYAADRTPQPVLELLATVANGTAGPDGTYRSRTSPDTIRRFHDAAKRHRALLLLNIQPGRAPVLGEVKALREWLVHPDVGIALDPEWEMGPDQVPGDSYGHTSGKELTDVARYLSGIVAEHDLPQKPLVFHQVAVSVVRDQSALRPQPGVVLIKSADGIGSPGMKRDTWRQLVKDQPEGLRTGFKLFYEEDTEGSRLMTPEEVLALRPRPDYVMFE